MHNEQIHVSRFNVMERVHKVTAYIGGKDSNPARYELIASEEADEEMLNEYLGEAGRIVEEICTRYIVDSEIDSISGDTTYIMELPDCCPHNGGTIGLRIEDFAVSFVVAKWCSLTDKAETDYYEKSAAETLRKLKVVVNKRVAPMRTMIERHDPEDYIESI